MLNQIKSFRENQQKKQLYKSLTSMRSLAVSIQSYNLFYAIKFASFFYLLAVSFIPNDYVRVLSAVFFGFFTSKTMKDIGIHIEKGKEWVIVSLAVFDFLMLCVILDVFHKTDHIDILNLLIFCLFVPYLGYWLNHVFVLKVKENEAKEIADLEHSRADLEQILKTISSSKAELADIKNHSENVKHNLADIEQTRADLEQISKTISSSKAELAGVKNKCENAKHNLADLSLQKESLSASVSFLDLRRKEIEKYIDERICPHCEQIFKSEKSRDGHKGRCKMNPKNIAK
ncbi:hypothetical protein [Tenacibaculum piscium]|uniref:hypothetical protein n=1 Tax=Tenacibaculum piscium TaxID=1458515 RepID=UPI0023B92434|nr:hypothetical protein [Tenacibaculum piscium]